MVWSQLAAGWADRLPGLIPGRLYWEGIAILGPQHHGYPQPQKQQSSQASIGLTYVVERIGRPGPEAVEEEEEVVEVRWNG
mmetsp:Transcript_28519/g.80464  ORF Transcript_28519/g.80464 Transcript_28519/m.80464 type:complete len:81 (-) Transcript_28519:689-931(-)